MSVRNFHIERHPNFNIVKLKFEIVFNGKTEISEQFDYVFAEILSGHLNSKLGLKIKNNNLLDFNLPFRRYNFTSDITKTLVNAFSRVSQSGKVLGSVNESTFCEISLFDV